MSIYVQIHVQLSQIRISISAKGEKEEEVEEEEDGTEEQEEEDEEEDDAQEEGDNFMVMLWKCYLQSSLLSIY